MFCQKCGAEIGEVAFCPKCGAKVETGPLNESNRIQTGNIPTPNAAPAAQPQSGKGKNVGMIIGIAAATLLVLIVSIVVIKKPRSYCDSIYFVVYFLRRGKRQTK